MQKFINLKERERERERERESLLCVEKIENYAWNKWEKEWQMYSMRIRIKIRRFKIKEDKGIEKYRY